MSWGPPVCAKDDGPGVAADVSKDMSWVRKLIGKGSEPGVTANPVATDKTLLWVGGAPGFWKVV